MRLTASVCISQRTHPVTMATKLDCLSMHCTEKKKKMVTMAALPTKEGTNEQTKLILICIYTKTARLTEIIISYLCN
jgi:hypothetical protein